MKNEYSLSEDRRLLVIRTDIDEKTKSTIVIDLGSTL